MHEKTREALSIDVRGHIVVVDEAHNLVDALNDIHTVQLGIHLVHLLIYLYCF